MRFKKLNNKCRIKIRDLNLERDSLNIVHLRVRR